MRSFRRWSILISLSASLAACGGVGKTAQSQAAAALDNLGCKASQSEMWTHLNKIVEDGDTYPSPAELRLALLSAGHQRGHQGPAFERYVDAFVSNYDLTISGIQEKFAPQTEAYWKKALAEMEVGIRVTEVHAELTSKIQSSLQKLAAAEKELNAQCSQPEPEPAPVTPDVPDQPLIPNSYRNVWEQLKAEADPGVYGLNLVLATTYQSCDVLKVPPLNARTPAMEGVVKDSKPNPQNGGIVRHYGDKNKINATHPYIGSNRLAKNSCYEVRNNPPIYDYGGKPATSSSKPKVLDLFNGNGGTGSEVFGMDCSGFVFSALTAAGRRMVSPETTLKASLVNALSATAMKEPQSNGMKCMEKIKVSKSNVLQPGDVVAIRGHVVLIDSVGPDPFGLNKATKLADCSALSADNFDFVIAQSAPVKGSTGIGKYSGKDYSKNESATFRNGFLAYAKAACRDKFGQPPDLNSPDLSIVRHKTTPECQEKEVMQLTKQECVDSCLPL